MQQLCRDVIGDTLKMLVNYSLRTQRSNKETETVFLLFVNIILMYYKLYLHKYFFVTYDVTAKFLHLELNPI